MSVAIVFGLRIIEPDIADDDLVVTMDADGEDRPEDFRRCSAALLRTPADRKRPASHVVQKRAESLRFRVMYFFFRVFRDAHRRHGAQWQLRRVPEVGWPARMLLHPYFDLCYWSTLVSLEIQVGTSVPLPRGSRYAGGRA